MMLFRRRKLLYVMLCFGLMLALTFMANWMLDAASNIPAGLLHCMCVDGSECNAVYDSCVYTCHSSVSVSDYRLYCGSIGS